MNKQISSVFSSTKKRILNHLGDQSPSGPSLYYLTQKIVNKYSHIKKKTGNEVDKRFTIDKLEPGSELFDYHKRTGVRSVVDTHNNQVSSFINVIDEESGSETLFLVTFKMNAGVK